MASKLWRTRLRHLSSKAAISSQNSATERLLAAYVLHQEYVELVKPFSVEMRKIKQRMLEASRSLFEKRRALLCGSSLPPPEEEMEGLLGKEELANARADITKAVQAAEPAKLASGMFWRDVLSEVSVESYDGGEVSEPSAVTPADAKLLEHLADVRCATVIDGDHEKIVLEFEFTHSAPLVPKTLRAIFIKEAATGKFLSCPEVTRFEFKDKESDPRFRKKTISGKIRNSKKKGKKSPLVNYVKCPSFFHIFQVVEDFEEPCDDEFESEEDETEEYYTPWVQYETTQTIVSRLQDDVVQNAADVFLSKYASAIFGAYDGLYDDEELYDDVEEPSNTLSRASNTRHRT